MTKSDDHLTWQGKLTELCAGDELATQLYPQFRANDLWVPTEQDCSLLG